MMIVHEFFLFAKDLNIGLGVLTAEERKGNQEVVMTVFVAFKE
jgi:hypothetical protein